MGTHRRQQPTGALIQGRSGCGSESAGYLEGLAGCREQGLGCSRGQSNKCRLVARPGRVPIAGLYLLRSREGMEGRIGRHL